MILFDQLPKSQRSTFTASHSFQLAQFNSLWNKWLPGNWRPLVLYKFLDQSKTKIWDHSSAILSHMGFGKFCNASGPPFLFNPFSFLCVELLQLGRRQWHPLQYSCLENPMDRGAWWAVVHGVAKRQTQLSDFTFTFHFHALEKEMATHSSVLAWRTPGTGEPGGLPSMGSHRVGHDWSDLAAAAAAAAR